MKVIKKHWLYFSIPFIIVVIIAAIYISKAVMHTTPEDTAPEGTAPEGTAVSPTSESMSAVETVQYYFSEFNNKNQTNFDSVVYEKMRGAQYDLADLNYVKLISCVEANNTQTGEAAWPDAWYPNPYATAVVDVTFDINYKDGGGGGFSNGKVSWHYWLVKKDENSDWMIVMWGVP